MLRVEASAKKMASRPADAVQQILEFTAQSDRELRAIQSPRETYEKKVEAVKARINDTWAHLLSGSSLSEQARLRDEVVGGGGELELLKTQYEATVADEEKFHEQQQWATLERLCCSLVTTLGEAIVKRSLQKISSKATNQAIAVSPSRIQENTQASLDHSSRNGHVSPLSVAGVKNLVPSVEATKVSVLCLKLERIELTY